MPVDPQPLAILVAVVAVAADVAALPREVAGAAKRDRPLPEHLHAGALSRGSLATPADVQRQRRAILCHRELERQSLGADPDVITARRPRRCDAVAHGPQRDHDPIALAVQRLDVVETDHAGDGVRRPRWSFPLEETTGEQVAFALGALDGHGRVEWKIP